MMEISNHSNKSSECIKVVVRCRPPNEKEIQQGRKSIVTMNTSMGEVILDNPKQANRDNGHGEQAANNIKRFTFDSVYDDNSTQRMVYDEVAFPLVESVLEGFNGTIFAYGQTGCGKTWTMTGREDTEEEASKLEQNERGRLRGIIPNSFDHIFTTIKLRLAENNKSSQSEFLVRASYLEIYNEDIRDLISNDNKKPLELKETPDKGVYVKDLQYRIVEDREQIDAVLAQGSKNRTVGATLMNDVSSRSHSIFSVVIEMNQVDEQGENHFRVGKLNLVDLAGSERQSKTGATGERLKEGSKINLSLSALGNVISALVDGRGKHIPYRDSKLTRLLQDSLGGNTKTVMISAISPADYNYEETLSTLRYANRAKNIKNKPIVNEDPKDALLREYKDEIEKLKMLLQQASKGGVDASLSQLAPNQVKVVQAEKVVKVRDKSEKKRKAEHKALKEYSDAIVEQRNRLGEELDRKEEEIERERRERAILEQKLERLQKSVLNENGSQSASMEDLEMTAAKKEREYRASQLKLKQKRRKEAELEHAKRKAEEEKRAIEEECRNVQGVVEAKEKALRALKKNMIAKMDQARQEIRELEQEFQAERETLLETIREQTREIKRLDQVVDLFLPPKERSKLWELAEWDDDVGKWKLPKLKPRKGYTTLTLPGLNQGGAEVVSPEKERRSSASDIDRTTERDKNDAKDLEEEHRQRADRNKRRKQRKKRELGQERAVDDDNEIPSARMERRPSALSTSSSGSSSSNSSGSSSSASQEDGVHDASGERPIGNIPFDQQRREIYGDRCQSRQESRRRSSYSTPTPFPPSDLRPITPKTPAKPLHLAPLSITPKPKIS